MAIEDVLSNIRDLRREIEESPERASELGPQLRELVQEAAGIQDLALRTGTVGAVNCAGHCFHCHQHPSGGSILTARARRM